MPPHHNGLLTLWNCKLNINSSSTSGLGHGVLSQQQKINLYSIFSDFQVGFFFFFIKKDQVSAHYVPGAVFLTSVGEVTGVSF